MYWTIFFAVLILSSLVQSTLNSRFRKYSKIELSSSLTGAEVARKMLADHRINDVTVTCVKGHLTDHYNPADRTINLSEDVYYGRSVASAAVAAHETGHAVQDYVDYGPLRLRSSLVPIVNFANNTVQWVLLAGCILINIIGPSVLYLGIALFGATVLFSFITLPVEIDASQRAVQWLDGAGIVNEVTKPMAKDALKWAAYTYVVAAISSIATLLYYIGIARRD